MSQESTKVGEAQKNTVEEKIDSSKHFQSWMTLSQLADFLQVPPKAVYDLTHKKKIPFSKVGRRLRFNRDKIEQWLQQNSSEVFEVNPIQNHKWR